VFRAPLPDKGGMPGAPLNILAWLIKGEQSRAAGERLILPRAGNSMACRTQSQENAGQPEVMRFPL